MAPQDFIREAYAGALALVGNWWPLGIAIGAAILLVVGYRKSAVRIPWGQIGSIALCVLIGSVAACWMIFGAIALLPVAFLVAVVAGLIAAFAHLFKWLNGRKQRADLPCLWLRDRMAGKLTTDEKRALGKLHYNPIDEFGGCCFVADRYEPVSGFDYQGQADQWLEACQRAYRPSEENEG